IASRNAELSNTQIRSTITGMILDVPVKVGNSVIQSNTFNDGTTIASIADLNDMIFRGKVDETEVGRLREGMPVKLTIGALQDVALNAVLEYIAPKGAEENGVIMFEIKASTQIPQDLFVRAGYSANAEIVTDRRAGVLTVPESAVEFEGDKTFVNLLTSDSTATDQTFERKEVKLGLSNGVNVEVTEGLSGGEKLRGTKQPAIK
ncbi:efflux RND transporter periplasmic adaptor subunit, partial [Alistipes ihumii]